MDVTRLREIYTEGFELIRHFRPSQRLADNWRPFVPEEFDATLAVEEHRWFWRPDSVKFVLLAESHVYTDDLLCKVEVSMLPTAGQGSPSQFARFIYCLGYGNNVILNRIPVQPNTGTNDFWELLGKCAGTWEGVVGGLKWEVKTLEAMKEKGIWLVDASIHACMDPRRDKRWRNLGANCRETLYRNLINLSWEYVGPEIKNAEEVWYVGKTLKSVLHDDMLDQTKYIPQPAGCRNPIIRQEYNQQLKGLLAAINRVCGG
jgi:hypothetical protein